MLIILLPNWYNVCGCHSPVYHNITATAVYLLHPFITARVVVIWWQSLYLSRMQSQCGQHVCCTSTSTRWKRGLRWNTYGVDKHHHVCLVFCMSCICELPQDITVYLDYYRNSLSQVADHPMSSPCRVDRAGPFLAYRTIHLNDVAPASFRMTSLLDIIWWYSTHLIWVDDPASRVLLAIAAQQLRDTSGAVDTVAPRSSPQALPGST